MKQDIRKHPLPTEADREKRSREWADQIPDEENEPGPTRETYRDGSLISECWADGVSSRASDEP